MKVCLIYKNDGSTSNVIKVFKDEDEAEKYLNKMNNDRTFIEDKDGNKHYNEYYEWDTFVVE